MSPETWLRPVPTPALWALSLAAICGGLVVVVRAAYDLAHFRIDSLEAP